MSAAKPPRKWNSEHYPKTMTVRVTLEEHAGIQERADRVSLSDSRYLVRRGLGLKLPPIRDTRPLTDTERKDTEFLLFELRKVGVNLNQIARRLNSARLAGRRANVGDLERSTRALDGLIRLLRRRL